MLELIVGLTSVNSTYTYGKTAVSMTPTRLICVAGIFGSKTVSLICKTQPVHVAM